MSPQLELVDHGRPEGASFHLVQARIRWPAGVPSEGWGRSPRRDLAIAKALGEAVERHSQQCLPPTRLARALDLDTWLSPEQMVRYAHWQTAQPGWPMAPFDAGEARHWLASFAATGGRGPWVLADGVCNPRAFDAMYRRRLVMQASSSGCASAHSLDQAMLRAALELVERDALMRHWFAQQPGNPVRPGSLPAGPAQRVATLAAAGCAAGVQMLTMGQHPTWLAWAQHASRGFTSVGSACGLDAAGALDSALDELETQALPRLAGVPPQPLEPQQVRGPGDHAALYATPGHFRDADRLWHTPSPQVDFTTIADAFEVTPQAFYAQAQAGGHPIFGVDLSVPEAFDTPLGHPLHTVKAIAPELIPMCFGHGQLPLGMDRWQATAPTALHPFA